jgi:hypothetical protein
VGDQERDSNKEGRDDENERTILTLILVLHANYLFRGVDQK